MKQGRASGSRAGSVKREPICHPIDPGYASQIGAVQGSRNAVEERADGKSYRNPVGKMQSHHSGSQGRR